jgi:hypothetical protein
MPSTACTLLQFNPSDRRRARQFLQLPSLVYRDFPHWVPPLARQASAQLDPRRNPFFRHSEAAFFLTLDAQDQPIGRLAILDNRNYNAFNHSRTAFFHLFECLDQPQAAGELFSAGIEWARRRGLDEMRGPKGFSILEGLGLLVRGFEHRPAFGIPYNPPYYENLLIQSGFQPESELVSGYLGRASFHFPEKIQVVAELVKQRRGLKVMSFRSRQELRRIAPQLGELYNATLGGTVGNVPVTQDEVQAILSQLIWFADPHLIKIIAKDDQPVGFVFAYPDVSAALQRNLGRLFPFGWLDLLLEMRRTSWININGAGIAEQYRGLGGTALLFSELVKTVQDSRFDHADLVQIGTENDRMLRELRDLGVDFYKAHRMYRREL